MKKTLTLIKSGTSYCLKFEEKILTTISDKKINGSDIYEKIYFDLPANSKSQISIIPEGFDMDGSKIKEKEDRLVFDQLKVLFAKIDEAINESTVEKK